MLTAVLAALVSGQTTSSEFDPKEALRSLIEETRDAQAEVSRESKSIESTLKQVIDKADSSSFLQTKSLAQIAREIEDANNNKKQVLAIDSQRLQESKSQFKKSIEKLRRDTKLVQSGKSFLELDSD